MHINSCDRCSFYQTCSILNVTKTQQSRVCLCPVNIYTTLTWPAWSSLKRQLSRISNMQMICCFTFPIQKAYTVYLTQHLKTVHSNDDQSYHLQNYSKVKTVQICQKALWCWDTVSIPLTCFCINHKAERNMCQYFLCCGVCAASQCREQIFMKWK